MILKYAECPFHELQALKLSQRLLLEGFGFLSDWAEGSCASPLTHSSYQHPFIVSHSYSVNGGFHFFLN